MPHTLDITIPENLPIYTESNAIIHAIRQHAVVIVAGETGSGKTTQLAKLCLQAGIDGRIAHTQPRRMAARSVAARIAEETGCKLGQGVGYRVRFSDHSHRDDTLCVMTDGLLLAEIHHDRLFRRYQALIIDEAHERSLNIDFLLGYIKNILPRRPDLRLIITSATIDTERFSRFFNGAPIISVSGRGFPVDIHYRPVADHKNDRERDLPSAIVDAVDEATSIDPLGDMLVFLSGERDIRDTHHILQQHGLRDTEILPLYARLSATEQDRVFQNHRGRRIILATNIAETSLTVPGVRFVIDTGLARISRYSPRHRVQRLPIEAISQASANQRAGRCGRIAAGICFRLYSETDFQTRPLHTDPEIRRTHLASVLLRMADMCLGKIEDFPLMEAPESRAIHDGRLLLQELQALDTEGEITTTGRQMARLPLDPRFARMLLAASGEQALHEVLIIVCGLSIPDPRLRPAEAQEKADQQHRQWVNESSDFLTLLRLWQWFEAQQRHHTRSKMRRICKQNYLSILRLREWHDLHHQVKQSLQSMKLTWNTEAAHADQIHRVILTGLLSQVGQRQEDGSFLGARGVRFSMMHGSALRKKPPPWLMAAGLLELRQRYAITVAHIDPAWLIPLAKHLLTCSYGDPYWSKRRGQVLAREQRSLFGLLLDTRLICWGLHDASAARSLFIQEALVAGNMQQARNPVLRRFQAALQTCWQQVDQHIGKSRRLYREDAEIRAVTFFEQKLPAHVSDQRALERWLKKQGDHHPIPELVDLFPDAEDASLDFPDFLDMGQYRFTIRYHFDPQDSHDGMTLSLPEQALGLLGVQRVAWLVPGLLLEKLIFLFKKLPTAQRRQLVPVPPFAAACLEALDFANGDLYAAVSRELQRMAGINIPPQQWQQQHLPSHLCMHIKVLDKQGKTLAEGNDIIALQQRHMMPQSPAPVTAKNQPMRSWDCPRLPESCCRTRNGRTVTLFPALLDTGDSVQVHECDSPEEAKNIMRQGLIRLFSLQLNQQIQWVRKKLPQRQKLAMYNALLDEKTPVMEQLIQACVIHVFLSDPWPRHAEAFQQRLDDGRASWIPEAESLAAALLLTLQCYSELQQSLKQAQSHEKKHIAKQIKAQLEQLIYPNFIQKIPYPKLQHLPRYLAAAEQRLANGPRRFARDQQDETACAALWQAYIQHATCYPTSLQHEDMVAFRWSLEELRVSLFTPQLKAAEAVSIKRLQQRWQSVVCGC